MSLYERVGNQQWDGGVCPHTPYCDIHNAERVERWRGRLTREQVQAIRDSTETGRVLAARYGLHVNMVWRIKRGQSYAAVG